MFSTTIEAEIGAPREASSAAWLWIYAPAAATSESRCGELRISM